MSSFWSACNKCKSDKCRRPRDKVTKAAYSRRLSLSFTVNDMSHKYPNYIYGLLTRAQNQRAWIIQHIYLAGNFVGSQTWQRECLHWYFTLTHAGKCQAGDSDSLISRFLLETPEPVGGLELEKKGFLSVSTSSLHGDPECTFFFCVWGGFDDWNRIRTNVG